MYNIISIQLPPQEYALLSTDLTASGIYQATMLIDDIYNDTESFICYAYFGSESIATDAFSLTLLGMY